MKFEADRAEVLAALAQCKEVSESVSPHENFRHTFLFSDKKDTIACLAMNETMRLRTRFRGSLKETGRVAIDTRKLNDIVAALPPGKFALSTDGKKTVFKSLVMKRQYTMTCTTIDTPNMEVPPAHERQLDATELLDAWDQIEFARAVDKESRYPPGCNFNVMLDRFMVQTTNSHTLGRVFFGKGCALPGQLFLPAPIFPILRLMAKSSATLHLSSTPDRIYCENEDTILSAALPAARLPEAIDQQLVVVMQDAERGAWFKVDAERFRTAIKSVTVFGNDVDRRLPLVTIELANGKLRLRSTVEGLGNGDEEVEVSACDGDLNRSYDGNYLSNSIRHLTGDVTVRHSPEWKSLILSQGEFVALVMQIMI